MDLPEVQTRRDWAIECQLHLQAIRDADPTVADNPHYKLVFAIANTIAVSGTMPSTIFLREKRKVGWTKKAFDAAAEWFEQQLHWLVQAGVISSLPAWRLIRFSTNGRLPALHAFALRTERCSDSPTPSSAANEGNGLDLRGEEDQPGLAQRARDRPDTQEPNRDAAAETVSEQSYADPPGGSKYRDADRDQVRDALFQTLIERVTMLREDVADRFVAASLYCVIGYWVVVAWGGAFSPGALPDTSSWSSPIDPIWRLLNPIAERLCIRMR